MTPRVLLLVTTSEWGGAQHAVWLLASHLRDRYDVGVACAPGGELVARAGALGVRVVEIPEFQHGILPWREAAALRRLERLLRTQRFDLVHVHSTRAGFWGRLAARRAAVPVVLFTAHGWAFAEGRPVPMRALLAAAERMAARWTTRIICVSEYDRHVAHRFRVGRPDQLVVIRNGSAPGDAPPRTGHEVRRELGLPDGPILAFIGRLARQKDPLTALQALRVLPEGALLIVGDGPWRARVEAFVRRHALERRVVVAGLRTDVRRLLAASDIFVLPSRWEGLPFAVIEAMMAGLPVVAARVGGLPELIEDGVTGLLVPPGDPPALAAALRRLIVDPALRRQMGSAGREKALREFTLERMLRETAALYDALLR
ncbi:MAG: glycosyltransferase family 4 protein [Armatimonadetes bacterium]|nr:glycosyltransferase family 4 protein [Armatimonadota bacterium]